MALNHGLRFAAFALLSVCSTQSNALIAELSHKVLTVELGQPASNSLVVKSDAARKDCGVRMEEVSGVSFSYQVMPQPGSEKGAPPNKAVELSNNTPQKFRLLFASLGALRDKAISLEIFCGAAQTPLATETFTLTVMPPPAPSAGSTSGRATASFVPQQCETWAAEHLVTYFKNILILRPTGAALKAYEPDRYPRFGVLDISFEVDEVIQGSPSGITRIEGWSDAGKPASSRIDFGRTYLAAGNDGVLHWQTCSPQWLTPVNVQHECQTYRVRRLAAEPIALNERCESLDIEHYLERLNAQAVLLNGVDRLSALKELWFEETHHRWDGGPVDNSVLLREPNKKRHILTMTPERLEALQ